MPCWANRRPRLFAGGSGSRQALTPSSTVQARTLYAQDLQQITDIPLFRPLLIYYLWIESVLNGSAGRPSLLNKFAH